MIRSAYSPLRRSALIALLVCSIGSARADDKPSAPSADSTPKQPGVVKQEFIFDKTPFAQCHASTIAQTKSGLVAAWFGGTREGNADVGVWLSRFDGQRWSDVVEVADGVQGKGQRFPCWNPVLFQPSTGPLMLFYKVGSNPRQWWGMLITSTDEGKTWSKPRRLPEGIAGPIKNKPFELADGTLLCPSSTEHDGWRVHMERTSDGGRSWKSTGPLNDGREIGAIQPTVLRHKDELQILCRSRQSRIVTASSKDDGKTWSAVTKTSLPNPNSGIDGVTLRDGRSLLVYNHTTRGRSPLNIAVSADGRRWQAALVCENQPGEYSYPAVIQTSDGLVHATYTWKRRRVKHLVIDPRKLILREMPNGHWPK